jgi:hypothetical protein
LGQDSLRLTQLSAGDSPVAWALRVARMHPDSLVLWTGRTQAMTGARAGDTTEVFLYPNGDACSEAPHSVSVHRICSQGEGGQRQLQLPGPR